MFNRQFHILFLFIYLLLSSKIVAQENKPDSLVSIYNKTKTYKITTVYGVEYRGQVIEEKIDHIVISENKTKRKIKLNSSEIKEFEEIKTQKVYDVKRFDDGYYSNYVMISENALPFRKQGFSSCYHYFLMQNLNYSFTEHWAISTNLLIFLPSSIGVKCSYKISNDMYVGGNGYIFGFPSSTYGYFSPLFGGAARITKGNDNTNFTLGGGIMGIKNTDSTGHNTSPYLSLYYLNFAYSTRFAKHFAFAAENFVFPQSVSYRQSPININLTGVCLKWLRKPNEHWNFGCYGLYVGSLTKLNKNSKILPVPYISYSTFLN